MRVDFQIALALGLSLNTAPSVVAQNPATNASVAENKDVALQSVAESEREVLAAIHGRLEAVAKNDPTAWSTFVDQNMLSPLEGRTTSKQAWIDSHTNWPREVKYWYSPLEDVKVRFHGATAVVTYHAKQFNEIGGQTTFVNRWQIETHVKKEGRWLLVELADSVIPAEPVAAKINTSIYDSYVGQYEWGAHSHWQCEARARPAIAAVCGTGSGRIAAGE